MTEIVLLIVHARLAIISGAEYGEWWPGAASELWAWGQKMNATSSS